MSERVTNYVLWGLVVVLWVPLLLVSYWMPAAVFTANMLKGV